MKRKREGHVGGKGWSGATMLVEAGSRLAEAETGKHRFQAGTKDFV